MRLLHLTNKRIRFHVVLIMFIASWCYVGAAVAAPSTFRVDGYSVEVNWKVVKKNRRFVTWGIVKGGAKCRQLHLDISFENPKIPHIEQLRPVVENYQPVDGGREYHGRIKAFTKKSRNQWTVKDISLKCNR